MKRPDSGDNLAYLSLLVRRSHALPRGFFHHNLRQKMNGFKPNSTGRNYVSKGTHKKIWAPIACVAPPYVCSYVASPFDGLTPSERKRPPISDFGVESRDPTAIIFFKFMPIVKNSGFFTHRRTGDRKMAIL